MEKQEMLEFADIVAQAVVKAINSQNGSNKSSLPKQEKNAYQKTEQLLYNYNGFKKIVAERMQEIEEIRAHGVPKKCGGVTEYVQKGGLPQGIVLEEETVESAVCRIERSVEGTVQAIALIDKCMAALKNDPYYEILEMRYFEGRTQEDMAVRLGCVQSNISYHRSRLVKELAMRIFPNQVIDEMMK